MKYANRAPLGAALLVLVVGALQSFDTGVQAAVAPLVDPRAAGLVRLMATSRVKPDVRFVDAFPAFVLAEVPVAGPSLVARARSYLESYADLYGQRSGRTTLAPQRRSQSGDEPQFVVFQQFVDGIPVMGGQLAVFLDDQNVLASVGNLLVDDPPVGGEPAVPQAHAEDVARRAACRTCGAPVAASGPEMEIVGRTQVVVVENGRRRAADGSVTPSDLRLAWRVAVGRDATEVVVVDAATRAVLFSYPLTANGYRLDLYDANGVDFGCFIWLNTLIGHGSGVFGQFQGIADAPLAVTESRAAYDFYKLQFGRDSYDNDGTRQNVIVRHPTAGSAAWTPCHTLVFNPGEVARDVYTHEFTHGVDDFASDLVYHTQSGALDESFADIMGSLNEFLSDPANADWTIGEDTLGGAIRNMANPTAFGQPDRMSQYQSLPDDKANDWGGVHTNSGIHNKAAFLMADGQFFNGVSVKGFGKPKLAMLAYKTLTSLPQTLAFRSFATFKMARDTALTIAQSMAKKGTVGFNDEDVCAVRNAYAATEITPVGTADQDCDGTLDQEDADDDGDFVPDAADNCPASKNPSQADADGDGTGDVCDGDPDNDGRITDNCPLVANADQFDTDGDGIGDACSDKDGDQIIDGSDNCPLKANNSQTDTDGDKKGDACDTDDDDDGVFDFDDNCPVTKNPDQADSDGGGIGDACDPTPNDPTNDSILKLNVLTRMKRDIRIGPNPPDPTGLIKLLVDFCSGGCTDGWLGDGRVILQLTGLPQGARAWISSGDGKRVAQPKDQGLTTAVFDFTGKGQGEYAINILPAVQTEPFVLGIEAHYVGGATTPSAR
jgi:Zn-dependent metalloprotease